MTALKVVVLLQLDSVEMIRAWSFAKSSLLTGRSLLQLVIVLTDTFCEMSNTEASKGAKETTGLNNASGLGAQLPVRLFYSAAAIWQLMTKVSLYNKQEKYRSRNPALCNCQQGMTAAQQGKGSWPGAAGTRTAAPPALPRLRAHSCFRSLAFPMLTAGLDQCC